MVSLYSQRESLVAQDNSKGNGMPSWEMDGWTKGPVTLQQAFGIKKGNVQFTPFVATLPGQVGGAQDSSSSGKKGSRSGGGNLNGFHGGGGSASANQALGKQMAAAYGWSGAEWTALNNIVEAESGWVTTIHNGGGLGYVPGLAYGIPQALPGTKMASAGADWQTNPATQIKWMLGYIRSSYGDPIRAWQFHLAHGWY